MHQNIRQKNLGSGDLAKLTGGYEMRAYWFEVFECARKICLIGLPIFFEPGSAGQLIVGLLVCFISFGMYASYEPYVKDSDDWLAKVAQVSLFFSLVSSIALKVESDSSTEALGNVLLLFTLAGAASCLRFSLRVTSTLRRAATSRTSRRRRSSASRARSATASSSTFARQRSCAPQPPRYRTKNWLPSLRAQHVLLPELPPQNDTEIVI